MKTEHEKTMKVAFIGCGNIAHIHYHCLNKLGVKVSSVCDSSSTRAELFARKYNIPNYYNSLEEMLSNETPNILHVLTPPQTHYDIIDSGLENGCHIFVEKPLCETGLEAESLFKKAKEKEINICVDHTRVYNPMIVKARKVLDSCRYGKVVRMEYDYDDPSLNTDDESNPNLVKGIPIWVKKMKGGMIEDLLPHPLSVMLSIVPDLKPKYINSRINKNNIIEELYVHMSSDSVDALIKLSLKIKPMRNVFRIFCQNGIIKIDLRNMYTVFLPDRKIPNILARVINTFSEVAQMGFGFISSIIRIIFGRVFTYSGLDEIYKKFYQQVCENKTAEIPLINANDVVKISEDIIEEAARGKEETISTVTHGIKYKDRLNKKADCLVTGGTGFIGSALVKNLITKNKKVKVLVRPNSNIQSIPEKAGLVFGDLRDKKALKDALKGIKTVFHCAAAMGGDWADYYESTILGNKYFLEALNESGAEKFIFVSSLGILNYNKLKNHDNVDENSPVEDNTEARGFYTRAKKESEDLVHRFALENKKINTIIVRPGLVYGKESIKNLENSGVLLDRFLFVFGFGKRYLGLNYVENLADLLTKAAESECVSGTVLQAVDPDQPTVSEYIKKHNELTGNSVVPIYVPVFIWKMAFTCVDWLLLFKSGTKGSFAYKIASNSKILYFQSDYCQRLLKWSPSYSFIESMKIIYSKD